MTPPLARSNLEAHLYMDLRPCDCGEVRFARASAVVTLPDGGLASRYTGGCAHCDRPREFVFRLPAEITPAGYGGSEPSQLLDAGEWLAVADRYARAIPPRLPAAAAALDEVLKFVPPGGDAVPPALLWTETGRVVYAQEPGRFDAARLIAVRDTYRAS